MYNQRGFRLLNAPRRPDMKIGIVGGTGEIGEGLARRLSHKYKVILGSRDKDRAEETSSCTIDLLKGRGCNNCYCSGGTNQDAVDGGDVIVLSIPFKHLKSTIGSLSGFEDKIIISPINPIARNDYFTYQPPPEGSAALALKNMLPESARIVVAFNNVAANKWKHLDEELDYSVAVCGDDNDAKRVVMGIVENVSHLRAYDAGPLSMSPIIEGITPLVLNIARLNGMKDVGIEFK